MARWQVPVVLGAVAAGLVLGLGVDVGDSLQRLVLPALVALLTLTFLTIRPGALTEAVRPHRRTAVASLGLNFVWAPFAAGLLGWLFLSGNPELRVGLVMLLVTPCTDWYLVFIATARGNVALGAALLPVNLVLQLALLPGFILVLTGAASDIPIRGLLPAVVAVLGVPLAVALVIRSVASRRRSSKQLDALLGRCGPLGLALLAIAVAAIFATHAQLVVNEPTALLEVLPPLLVFFAATYLLAASTARRLHLAHPEQVTLTMTAMARNSPVALAVATAAFPHQPLIALALVVGPLIELPVLSVAAHRLVQHAAPAPGAE